MDRGRRETGNGRCRRTFLGLAPARPACCVAAALVVLALAGTAVAGPAPTPAPDLVQAAAMMRLSSAVPVPVVQKMRLAFPHAVLRVQRHTACRALFESLGADGVELLTTTTYLAAQGPLASGGCAHGADALTTVGGRVTWLCPSFGRLSTTRAMVVLLHEALHAAGLTERPQDPAGLSSTEINLLVKERCGL